MDEALVLFERAMRIQRQFAVTNPEAYEPHLAKTLNNLGILYHEWRRLEEACKAYEEARSIYRRLAEVNPDAYRPDEAGTLSNLGNLYRDQNRIGEARQAHEEAFSIYARLAMVDPNTYMPDVMRTLKNLALLGKSRDRTGDNRGQIPIMDILVPLSLPQRIPSIRSPSISRGLLSQSPIILQPSSIPTDILPGNGGVVKGKQPTPESPRGFGHRYTPMHTDGVPRGHPLRGTQQAPG